MSELNFHDHGLMQNSSVPWNPEEAVALGYTKWMDRNGCAECNKRGLPRGSKMRYTENNMCVGCLLEEARECFRTWEMGDPSRPEPWSTSREKSLELGIDYYYGGRNHMPACLYGPHLRKTHITTGKCLNCAEAKRRLSSPRAVARRDGLTNYIPISECPHCHTKAERNVVTNACSGCKVKSPRASARAAGYPTYIPDKECYRCHTKAERNVVTNACSGCKTDARRSISQIYAAEHPDAIMDKETAKFFGLKLYRTGKSCNRGHMGWRYISTNNCVECRS